MDEDALKLMRANLDEVFGQRDPAAQAAAAERTYTEDVVFTDPEETVKGRAAVLAKARAVLAKAPGDWAFVEDGPLYSRPGEYALAWSFGPPQGPAVVRGIDVATIEGGRIARLLTLLAE